MGLVEDTEAPADAQTAEAMGARYTNKYSHLAICQRRAPAIVKGREYALDEKYTL